MYSAFAATRWPRLVVASLLFLFLAGVPRLVSAQTTVTLDAPGSELNSDMTIRDGGYASVNYSQSDSLESKRSSQNYNRRILLKFDTQNRIPAGAVINSAKLYLVLKEADGSTKRPIAVYRVTKSFHSDATWFEYTNDRRWSTAGGDLAEKYLTKYVGGAVGATYHFDVTQLVQRAVRGDFGSRYTRMALVDIGSPSSDSYRRFHSTRSGNASLRPRLVVSYGASSEPTSSTNGGATLRVMQWNIHKTKGTDGRCNPDRIASWVARLAPHVVSMNEVSYYSGCAYTSDQGATLEGLIERKTGHVWYRKFVRANDKVNNVILSRYRFASSGTHSLSYQRGVVQVGIVVNGRTVNLFSTHVDYYNSGWRTTQIKQAKSWIGNFSAPRIVMGDFNTNPGTSDYRLMTDAYADAWTEAKRIGTASSYKSNGATHGASRFDYVFKKGGALVVKSVKVPDTRTSGVYPSDHDPVVAVFQVQ